jgi:VanZ family protein
MSTSERSTSKPHRVLWWVGLGATVLCTLGALRLAYEDRMPDPFRENDKLVHFCFAGALAFFLDGALARRMLRASSLSLPASSVLLLVPMGLEEYLQRYAAARTSSLGDFAADVAGVTAFTWLSRRMVA